MLWKCSVCGLISEGEQAPEKCPKCNVGPDKFVALEKDAADKIYAADRTNDILMSLDKEAVKMIALCNEGLEIGLDPGCIASFKGSLKRAWEIKQSVKAEIAIHVSKEKF